MLMSVAASGDSTGDSVVRSVSSGSSWVIEVDDWLSSACAFSSSGRVSDVSDWQFSGTERMLSAMLLLRSDFVPSSSEEASPSDYGRWLYTAFTRATEVLYLVNWPEARTEG